MVASIVIPAKAGIQREQKGHNVNGKRIIAVMGAWPIFGAVAIAVGLLLALDRVAGAEPPQVEEQGTRRVEPQGRATLILPTLGGKQFWSDELVFHQWRIQKNVITNHYRLLDDKNVRRSWGSFDECRAKLDALKRELDMPPMKKQVVIVLHGLVRSRTSMDKLADYLNEHSEMEAVSVSYASTRGDVADHAASLASVVANLDGVERIHFVGHSLGNIVIRYYLGEHAGDKADKRIGRIVMLAPPNQGAVLAERFGDNALFELISGSSGKQIADWEELEPKLAVPQGEFGIVAGSAVPDAGGNPLIEGDDDLVLAVEETKLAGAADFRVAQVEHTFIMNDDNVRKWVQSFLENGYFVSAEERKPIEAAAE